MLAAHHTTVTQGFPSTQRQTAAPDWVPATAAIYFLPLLSRIVRLSSVLCSHQGNQVRVPPAATSPDAVSCLGLGSVCGSPLA